MRQIKLIQISLKKHVLKRFDVSIKNLTDNKFVFKYIRAIARYI